MKYNFAATKLGLFFLIFKYENLTITGKFNIRVENHYSSDVLLLFHVKRAFFHEQNMLGDRGLATNETNAF